MDKITLNINELPKFNYNMMTIKERNSKDLQKAWKKFLRTQNEKEKNKKDEKENQGIAEKGCFRRLET